jgi:SAM-dependent methyltransferase
MNDWVGGSDPEAVGTACVGIVSRYLTLGPQVRLLDFGCGIGRVTAALLKQHPNVAAVVGLDIVPPLVQFCRQHISATSPCASFELVVGSNDHYDQFIDSADQIQARSHQDIRDQFGHSFSSAFSFSVFTHLEKSDFAASLRFLADLLQPGGELLFTAFVLTPYSRQAIDRQETLFPFEHTAFEEEGDIFIGNRFDRLGFIAFDQALIGQMVFDAGLVLDRLEFGSWTGAGFSGSLQDVIVCRKPRERTEKVTHVPIVPRPPRDQHC